MANRSNNFLSTAMCSSFVFVKTMMSSTKTAMLSISRSVSSIRLLKYLGAFRRPNGSLVNSNLPKHVEKAVLCLSSSLIFT